MKRPLAVIALELAKKVALVLELEAADSNYLLPNP
jgi:hypothetical protein